MLLNIKGNSKLPLPILTIAVPSLNQGAYLDKNLSSIFQQNIPVEVFIADAGSKDNSVEIIKKWEHRLAGWYSHTDSGQSSAINSCIANGTAPFVAWLNSDDWFLNDSLKHLLYALQNSPESVPAAYGRAFNFNETKQTTKPAWVENFNEKRLALRCIMTQPATLIRRSAWEAVGGLDTNLHMAMDYDLWWRLYKKFGPPIFVNEFIAVNREHKKTKTNTNRKLHYKEAIDTVRKYYEKVPLKWWLYQPYAVWFRTFMSKF